MLVAVQFRGAWYKSINYPDLKDTLQALTISAPDASVRSITVNPVELQPWTATNFDLAYERYYGAKHENNISVGLFRKELKNFLFNYTGRSLATVTAPDGSTTTEFRSTSFVANGSSQNIDGLEFSWTQSFDRFLPAPFDGFGLVANYTYIKGRETTPLIDPDTLEILRQQTSSRLTNQPKDILNVQIYWEKWRLSARLAYNHVAEFQRNIFDVAFPTLQAPVTTLDASVQFKLTNRLRLALDVKNITKEASSWIYNTNPAFPESYGEAGRMWVAGIRGAF